MQMLPPDLAHFKEVPRLSICIMKLFVRAWHLVGKADVQTHS